MRKSEIIILAIALLSFVVAGLFYAHMPEIMASHWNAKGEADGYTPKLWALLLMPIISLLLFFLFILIPRIDPLKENIEKFRKYFNGFIITIFLFLIYIYALTIFWNLGKEFNMTMAIVPAFSVLFYFAGVMVEHAKRNWFIGLRTPWTLSSDYVWDKTHKLGGRFFKIAAIVGLLGLLFPSLAIYFIIIPALSFAIVPTIYSYLLYKKEKEKNNKN